MIHKYILLLLIVLFICRCSGNGNIEREIKNTISKVCINNDCRIVISKLTDFKWDKMFVFDSPVSLETITEAIGTDYPGYVEFSRTLIFMNKGSIVYYENNPSKIETFTPGQVIFNYHHSVKYKMFLPNNAIFKVKTKTSDEGDYYILYQ